MCQEGLQWKRTWFTHSRSCWHGGRQTTGTGSPHATRNLGVWHSGAQTVQWGEGQRCWTAQQRTVCDSPKKVEGLVSSGDKTRGFGVKGLVLCGSYVDLHSFWWFFMVKNKKKVAALGWVWVTVRAASQSFKEWALQIQFTWILSFSDLDKTCKFEVIYFTVFLIP